MESRNGANKPDTTVDFGMRVVMRTNSYARVGQVMDLIANAVATVLEDERAAFDFTHINTHPCKAMRLAERQAMLEAEVPMPADSF
jgi:hypothetical protein